VGSPSSTLKHPPTTIRHLSRFRSPCVAITSTRVEAVWLPRYAHAAKSPAFVGTSGTRPGTGTVARRRVCVGRLPRFRAHEERRDQVSTYFGRSRHPAHSLPAHPAVTRPTTSPTSRSPSIATTIVHTPTPVSTVPHPRRHAQRASPGTYGASARIRPLSAASSADVDSLRPPAQPTLSGAREPP
jgi:hypothetical protein